MKKNAPHFSELDGLRGLLALWVAVTHILCWTGMSDFSGRLPLRFKEGWYVLIYAQAAVDAFIILSGFVISFLVVKFRGSYKSFMINRTFRIYPVFLVCLALSIATANLSPKILEESAWSDSEYFPALRVVAESEQANPIAHIALHLVLLNGLVPTSMLANASGTFLPPAWSITLEWQYYLLAPLIAAMAVSSRGLIALIMVAFLGMHLAQRWTNPHLAFLPSQLPLFLIGIATYHFIQIKSLYANATTKQIEFAVIAICGIGVLTQWHATAVVIWSLTVGTLLVGKSANSRTPLGGLGYMLRSPILQKLGSLSYPLYLVHWPLIIAMLYCILRVFPNISSLKAAAFMLVFGLPLILLISYLLHKQIEAPGIGLGKKVISGVRTQAVITEA